MRGKDLRQISSGNKTPQVPSTGSGLQQLPRGILSAAVTAAPMMELLERLVSAKRTVEFTDHQAETWLASLSVFDLSVVTEAVIRIAHSDDPFPDLGKLVMRCEAIRRQRSGNVGQGDTQLGSGTVNLLAKAWGVQF